MSWLNDNLFHFRLYIGLFSEPEIKFPHPPSHPSSDDILAFGNLVKPSDYLTNKVIIKGTTYVVGYIVVLEIVTKDVLVVGEIEKVLTRKSHIHFVVSLHDAVRHKFHFFETSPCQRMAVVRYDRLADYKPLFKRAHGTSFPFILHHHLSTPL